MSRERVNMNKQMEILRLRHDCGHSARRIHELLGISIGTVQRVLAVTAKVNISWPLPQRFD